MFRRDKGKDQGKGKGPVANKLAKSAEPNTLSNWTVDDAPADVELEEDDFEADDEVDEVEDDTDEPAKVDNRTPAQRRADLEAELQRQAEEFGLTGNNPVGLYGPNGEDVAALIESLPTIDYDTAEAIADAYEAASAAERKVAQSVIRRRHRNGKLGYELDTAERAVADWRSSLMVGEEDADLFGIVADAATDAVDALVLEEDLDDADFDTLYGPWSEVMDVEDEEDEEPDGEAVDEGEAPVAEADGDAEEAELVDEGEFGPYSKLVEEFLAVLGRLETPEVAELVTVWREQPKEELRNAHRALQALADEDSKWREQLRLAQEEVFVWIDGRDSRFYETAQATRDELRAREIAGPAVADAVAGITMADILEAEDAATLYAPWAEVIGEPALPTFEEDEGEEDEGDGAAEDDPKPAAAPKPKPKGKAPKK